MVTNRVLPNPWNVFNLRSSPFWQDSLGDGDSTHPLSLFVGRDKEIAQLLTGLYGAGESSSRRAIYGSPGIGKTTLVKQFKARALVDGYLTTDSFVPLVADETSEGLFGRVLGAVYDTILANRPATVDNLAMQAAQVLVRTARERARGGGASLFGVGVSVSQSVSATVPRDMLIDGPRVLRDLMTLVRQSDAQGILLHINNLENLTDADADRAGTVLRDLRDPMLMHNGLHIIVVGTQGAIQATVLAYPQVRTTFTVLPLNPLDRREMRALLEARYEHMRIDHDRPVIAPVEPQAVEALHDLFRGDLRGVLKALEDGVTPNIGLVPPRQGKGRSMSSVIRPLSLDELCPLLQQDYAQQLNALPEEVRVTQLATWGRTGADTLHTQKSLTRLWKVTQPAVSQALAFLMRQGYVMPLARQAGSPTQYALTGHSRLIFPPSAPRTAHSD